MLATGCQNLGRLNRKLSEVLSINIKYAPLSYRTGGNRKRSEQSMNADNRSLGKLLSIAICRQSGDKRLSKALFLAILDSRSSIVDDFDCLISEVFIYIGILNT